MARKLSENDDIRILMLLENGYTIKEVAQFCNIKQSIVMRVKKRWENEGNISRKSKGFELGIRQ